MRAIGFAQGLQEGSQGLGWPALRRPVSLGLFGGAQGSNELDHEILRMRFEQALSRGRSGLGAPGDSPAVVLFPAPRRGGAGVPHRTQEQAWRGDHAEALREFAGQWVVLEGERLIAHGADPALLAQEARARGIEVPYVFFVEAHSDAVVSLGL
jgi:hypothetical protein